MCSYRQHPIDQESVSEGASPNWMSISGKTPLILACAKADRLPVAQTLIELGADVNYYDTRIDGSVGTALHRAARRGLEQTVILLLSHGAIPLLCDGYGQHALDFARWRGHAAIVRAMEDKICLFSGWLREISSNLGPVHSAIKLWAVVLPSDYTLSGNVPELLKFFLYRDRQSPSPFKIVLLNKYDVQQPSFLLSDPELVLSKKTSGTKLKFLSGEVGDKEQLRLLYDTCRGKSKNNLSSSEAAARATPPPWHPSSSMAAPGPSTSQEEAEISMAISASIQSAVEEGTLLPDVDFGSHEEMRGYENTRPLTITEDRGPVAGEGTSGLSSSCIVCNDGPVEAACIPCGHMACCMACLTEVKMKNIGCPLCRSRIERITKIYLV